MSSEQQPKYLNSPENQLFKKRENLYELNFALSEILKKQHIFVFEGYLFLKGNSTYVIFSQVICNF
nr:hypothetical protein [Wolbachia endosymbiont of Atemnus politus]